jgi:hypothetical protein
MSELKQIGKILEQVYGGKPFACYPGAAIYLENHYKRDGKLFYGLAIILQTDGVVNIYSMEDIIKAFDLEVILRNMELTVDDPNRFIQKWRDVYKVEKVIKLYQRNNPSSPTLPLLEADLMGTLDKIWDELA